MTPPAPAIDPLLPGRLGHSDAGVRRIAVLELADLERPEHLPALTAALRGDPAPEVRAEAARVLAAWDDADVVDTLAQALLDAHAEVREAASASLAELNGVQAGARLLPWARHEQAFARAAALRALKPLRLPAAAEAAHESLAHADAAVRREAVGVLGWLKQADALPALARLAINDSDAEVRRSATGSLGLAGTGQVAQVLPALLAALGDPQWQVREEAATTLAKLRPPAALPGLLQAMQDEHWQVRLRAARALGRLQDAAALPALTEALAHPAGNLRKEAAIALGELGEVAGVAPLRLAAQDPDPEVRKAARLALARLGEELRP